MVLDTSVIFDILTGQPGHEQHMEALDQDEERFMSAVTLYETAVVLFSKSSGDSTLIDDLHEFVDRLDIRIVAFDSASAWQTFDAYTRFGKGVHRARLNLIDCTAYQLAKELDQTLLFRGDDFSRTDIRSAG